MSRFFPLLLLFSAALVPACGGANSSKISNSEKSLLASGLLTDDGGSLVAGAQVCAAGSPNCATSDANGTYFLAVQNSATDILVLNFSASGYASQTRRMPLTKALAPIVLRKLDKVATVTLPTDGAAPAVVPFARDDANMTLSFAAGTLVDKTGAVVTGDVEVRLSFWSPLSQLLSVPGRLIAEPATGPAPARLVTYGMTDAEVWQGDNKLQVAEGRAIDWSVQEPNLVLSPLTGKSTLASAMALYSLDEKTGLWHVESRVDTDGLTFDEATGTYKAKLTHLSAWNLDTDAAAGGCVTGLVLSPCDQTSLQPLPNALVTIWLMTYEELKPFNAPKADSQGRYCVNTPTRKGPVALTLTQTVPYFVSATSDWRDSSQTNPYQNNPDCFRCNAGAGGQGADDWCSYCACTDCFSKDLGNYEKIQQQQDASLGHHTYLPTAGALVASITADPGSDGLASLTPTCETNMQACEHLAPVYIKDPACPGVTPPKRVFVDPCSTQAPNGTRVNKPGHQGDPCGTNNLVCCPGGAGETFVCADYVCVDQRNTSLGK